MISHKHQFIFIHIPKTGGSSVEAALQDPSCDWLANQWDKRVPHTTLNHLTLQEMIDYGFLDIETASTYFKFCFVRNPWDRAVSEVCYLPQVFAGENVPEKLENLLTYEKYGNHVRPQIDFIDNSHNLEVDFIGRFERLEEDLNFIWSILGVSQKPIPHNLKTNHEPYWTYYNEGLCRRMSEKYEQDILRFDYSFHQT